MLTRGLFEPQCLMIVLETTATPVSFCFPKNFSRSWCVVSCSRCSVVIRRQLFLCDGEEVRSRSFFLTRQ